MYWFILKSILGSIIGSSFYNWFQGTTLGIWFQKHVDCAMQYLAEKHDLVVFKKDAKFRKQYPLIADRLDALEEDLNVLYEMNAKEINKHLSKTLDKQSEVNK